MTVQDGLQDAMLSNALSFAEGCTDGPKCRLDLRVHKREREVRKKALPAVTAYSFHDYHLAVLC